MQQNSMWIDDTIELPDLWFQDEMANNDVFHRSRRALDRTNHIYEQAERDTPRDIVGSENRGILSRSQLGAIKALSGVPLAKYTLKVDTTEYEFRFRNEDAPAVFGERIENRTFPDNQDHFKNVIIKIVIIG